MLSCLRTTMGLDPSTLTSAERLSLSRLHAKHKEMLGKMENVFQKNFITLRSSISCLKI